MDKTIKKSGVELIVQEMRRQISEGDILSEPIKHEMGELRLAAACYCMDEHTSPQDISSSGRAGIFISIKRTMLWPWIRTGITKNYNDYFKPSENKVYELIIAGALIAAEIDRLQSLK